MRISRNRLRLTGRLATLLVGSLILGVLVSQIHTGGIHWRFLEDSLPWTDPVRETVDPPEAYGLFLEGAGRFLDIRPAGEYAIDRIPGSVSLPLDSLLHDRFPESFFQEKSPWILYDFTGLSRESRVAFRVLHDQGVENVHVLTGGFARWLDLGLPVEDGGW